MIKRIVPFLLAAGLLSACKAGAPPPVTARPVAETVAPARQAEEAPKPRNDNPAQGKDDEEPEAKVTFDLPPGWDLAPASAVHKPWIMALTNPDLQAQVLVEFSIKGARLASKEVAEVTAICKANKWTCAAPRPLAGGDGASFTFSTGKDTRGKIAVRDLSGPGRHQLQLFGLWPKEKDAKSAKDFDTMLSTAKVE